VVLDPRGLSGFYRQEWQRLHPLFAGSLEVSLLLEHSCAGRNLIEFSGMNE
jgi:hypothetical protein